MGSARKTGCRPGAGLPRVWRSTSVFRSYQRRFHFSLSPSSRPSLSLCKTDEWHVGQSSGLWQSGVGAVPRERPLLLPWELGAQRPPCGCQPREDQPSGLPDPSWFLRRPVLLEAVASATPALYFILSATSTGGFFYPGALAVLPWLDSGCTPEPAAGPRGRGWGLRPRGWRQTCQTRALSAP